MNEEIHKYNSTQASPDAAIYNKLMKIIDKKLRFTESKIWHGHPVWFIDGNPIVGYSKLKDCIRLMFWSGDSFNEKDLQPGTDKFKDASIKYTDENQLKEKDIIKWLKKSRNYPMGLQKYLQNQR